MYKEKIIDQIKTVSDPEISLNIYELGLIYDISVEPINKVWNPSNIVPHLLEINAMF